MSVKSSLKNSISVVTGASGFIGSHLVDSLVEQGSFVHALVRKTSDRRWFRTSDNVKYHTIDLEQLDSASLPFLKEANYIFHCAGLTRAKTRESFFRVNAYACEAFYKKCVLLGINLKTIIHLSSLAAAGPTRQGIFAREEFPCNPVTYYGESKLAGEKIAIKYTPYLPIVVVRPPVVYGPREEIFLTYLRILNKGWKIKIGTVSRELSLIYIADLVRAVIKAALCFPGDERIYYVTDGHFYTWDKVAELAIKKLAVSAKTLVIPEVLLSFMANISEALSWPSPKPPLIDRQKVIDICQKSWTASPKSFFESYKFQPNYDLDKGLQETVVWCKRNNWL